MSEMDQHLNTVGHTLQICVRNVEPLFVRGEQTNWKVVTMHIPSWEGGNEAYHEKCYICGNNDEAIEKRYLHGGYDEDTGDDHIAVCESCWDKHYMALLSLNWYPCGCGG